MSSAAHDLRRFTADEYLRMIAHGILKEDDRVELVDGEILHMTPQAPEHSGLRNDLRDRLQHAYHDQPVFLLDQSPLHCGSRSVPEPDLAVVRGVPRDFLRAHPRGTDTLLVVELSKTSQQRDRNKATDYALGGVPVYWLIDLQAHTVDIYSRPGQERYHSVETLTVDDAVPLPTLDITWPVASLFAD